MSDVNLALQEGKIMKNTENNSYILTIVFIFIALTAMISYNFISFYSNSVSDMEAMGKSSLAQEAEHLNGYLIKGMDVLQVTAITVEYMMQNGADSKDIENFLLEESKRYMEDIDVNFTGIYGVFNDVYIDGIGWVPDEDYVPEEREWYIAAKKANGKPIVVSPYLDAQTNTIMVSVSKLLYDKKSVISLDIKMNQIQIITENIQLDGIGYGFIVDRAGLVVAHFDENEKGKNYLDDSEQKNLVERLYTEDDDTFEIYNSGEKCTVFKTTVMDDWYIAMIVKNSKLFEKIQTILLRNTVICVIVFALILIFLSFAMRRIRIYMKNEEESNRKLEKLNINIVRALARAIDAKDRYTNGHSQRVANYAVEIAKYMGKTQEEQSAVYYAGLMHDVGKIRVPENIINKPGKLSDEEYEQIKIHPVTGYYILKDIYEDKRIPTGAKFHHERYDGKGYPNGLKGENIPEIARIIGVADSYDAMASNRSYRNALPQNVVRDEIEKGKGSQFDPHIADIMLDMIDNDKTYKMKQSDTNHKNILIADSDEDNIKRIKSIMEDEALYIIFSVSDTDEIFAMLSENVFELVLLDVKMAEKNNFEIVKNIKEQYSIPVIIMTDDKDFRLIQDIPEIDDYLTKRFFPLSLKEIIHSILTE